MDGIAHCGQLKRTKRLLTVQVMETKKSTDYKMSGPIMQALNVYNHVLSSLHQHGESNCIANHTNLHVQSRASKQPIIILIKAILEFPASFHREWSALTS